VTAAVAWSTGAGATEFGVSALRAQQGNVDVVPGQSFTLTTGTDTLVGTAGNDTFSGTDIGTDTYDNNDRVVDGSTTDKDTLTLTLSGSATPNVVNVESIDISIASTNGTNPQITASSMAGVQTLTVTGVNVSVGGASIAGDKDVDVTAIDATKVAKVVAGAGAKDVTLVQTTKAGLVVDANTATGNISVTGPATIDAATTTGSVTVIGLAADNKKAVVVNAANALTVDVGNTTAVEGAVTVNAAKATVAKVTAAGGATIVAAGDKGTAGTNGVVVTAIDDSGATVTTSYVGSATSNAEGQIVLTAGAGTTDVATVSAAGETKLTLTDLETLNLSGNGRAATYVILNAAATTYAASGTYDVNLKGADSMFAGKTVTGAASVELSSGTAGAQDLSKVTAGSIKLGFDNQGNAITVKTGSTVELIKDQTTELEILSSTDKGTLTIKVGDDNGTSTATPELTVVTLKSNTADKTFSTVNIDASVGKFTAATSTVLTSSTNVVVTGSNDVTLGAVTAKSVDASALTGKLLGTTMAGDLATLTSGAGADNVTLNGAIKHTLATGAGVDTITVTSTAAATSIDAGSGDDVISVQDADAIVIVAGDGDDSITIGAAATTVDTDAIIVGGAGTDTLVIDSNNAAVDLSDNANFAISDIEKLDLTNLDQTLTISAAQLAGNKTLTLIGGGTADTFAVGKGTATGSVVIDLSGVTVASGSTVTISATGGDKADTITGSAKNDTFNQSKGADVIDGGAGTGDTYVGAASLTETGSDASQGIVANLSSTAVTGLSVFTALSVYTGAAGAEVAGGTVAMSYSASKAANSTIADTISNIENVTGTGGKDYIVGSTADNALSGGGDVDYIDGGAGDDTITGGAGNDTLKGGDGVDTFVFSTVATNGSDTVTDFVAGTGGDILKVNGLATLTGSTGNFLAATAAATSATTIASYKALAVGDAAAADWANVAAKIGAAIDESGAGSEKTVIAIDNGTDTRVYLYQNDGTDNAVQAAELTLVGTLSGVDAAALVAANFAFA